MINFIKKYILFNVDKEFKDYSREYIKKSDYQSLKFAMVAISIMQICMLIYTFIAKGVDFSNYYLSLKGYIICYASLAIIMLINRIVIETLYKHSNTIIYYIFVSMNMIELLAWATAMSVFDSALRTNLTTLAYVSIAVVAFISLEPWVTILNLITSTLAINLLLYFLPDFTFSSNAIVNSISILALGLLVSIFSFQRRIRAIEFEKEVRKLNATLNDKAYLDDLTTIYNRRYLSENIDTPLNLGLSPSGIMLFDIDDFKKINDNYGHLNGDKVLSSLGKLVSSYMDGKSGYAIRYGGEEFLLYFEHITIDDLYNQAQILKKLISDNEIDLLDGSKLSIHVSIGIAGARPGINYSALINEADNALYRAKEEGKNRVCK